MAVALIISSFVSASRIGGGAQQYVLAAHRIDPVLAPTIMFGRSPALGGKGEVTTPAVFQQMLGDIEADASFGELDVIIAGYFASPEQVEIAAGLVERVRARSPRHPVVVVDPIMGDDPGGLYVDAAAAEALLQRLTPLADWITPNAWEFARLSGRSGGDAHALANSCRTLGRRALVTSVPAGDGEIGLLFCDGDQAVLFAHERLAAAPKGSGDLVTASFAAGLAQGLAPLDAAERAARAVAEVIRTAQAWGSTDLPIVALADRLANPTAAVRIERL